MPLMFVPIESPYCPYATSCND